MDIKPADRLGDILIREEIVTSDQLDQAVQCQVLFGGRLGTNLLELGFISKKKLLDILTAKYGLPAATREQLRDVHPQTLKLAPATFAVAQVLVPLRKVGETLEVAMLDPTRESALAELRDRTGLKIQPLVALEMDIAWAIEKYYGVKRTVRFGNLDRWIEQTECVPKKPRRRKKAAAPEPLFPDAQDITRFEGAPKDLDDFWDRVGRTRHPEFHLPKVLEELNNANSRDEIAKILLDFAAIIYNRSILLVVNQDLVMGWDGRGPGIDSRIVNAIMFPLGKRSVFKTVVETGSYFLGPIPDTTINARFLAAFGEDQPKTALLLPLMIGDRVAAILYGDMGHDQKITGKFAPLQQAVAAAGQVFQRMILKSKAENPKPPGE